MKRKNNDEPDEENDSESEEDEQSEEENLEDLVIDSPMIIPPKTNLQIISPSLEFSDETQRLENELSNIPTNTPTNSETINPASQYNLGSDYMSNSYQSSNYASSIYPDTKKSQESSNPFDSRLSSFRSPSILQNSNQSSSGGYPNETETRKYEPVSSQKRNKNKY